MASLASAAQRELGFEEHDAEDNLDLRWRRFLNENPAAIDALVEIAREIKAAGHDRVSMKLVFEVARFRFLIRQAPGETFALNNSYTSRAARHIAKKHPDLAGLFEMRVLGGGRS
jgi:hypothetical protein